MPRLLSITWAFCASWICSAFFHVIDNDVGSIGGLADPSVLVSVSVVALILLGPVLVSHVVYFRKRWTGFWITIAVFAVGLGLVVALAGFGGSTAGEWWLAFGGLSLLLALMLTAAAAPAIWVERRCAGRAHATL